MSTFKYYEIFEQNGGLTSTGRSVYSTGATPEDCSFGVYCLMHYLNNAYPEQHHFEPFIQEDKVTVGYYKNGEGVHKTLAMTPAEEYPAQNWLYRNIQN